MMTAAEIDSQREERERERSAEGGIIVVEGGQPVDVVCVHFLDKILSLSIKYIVPVRFYVL